MTASDITARGAELKADGEMLVSRIGKSPIGGGPETWFESKYVPVLQEWIASTANFISLVATPDTYFFQECQRITEDNMLAHGVPYRLVKKLLALLSSILRELDAGLLGKPEYVFAASTFDGFIDHADEYHKANKKMEAAVLVSAVFEDSLRKVATKFGLEHDGKTLDWVINELVKNGHVTPDRAKRLKGIASLRDSALHSRWDEFRIRDVGAAIKDAREMIGDML